jgi:hypothetical protein
VVSWQHRPSDLEIIHIVDVYRSLCRHDKTEAFLTFEAPHSQRPYPRQVDGPVPNEHGAQFLSRLVLDNFCEWGIDK